jgi:hypothetical protein
MIHKFQSVTDAIRALKEESGKTCVSIILSLSHLTPGQEKDYQNLDRSVMEAIKMLDEQKAEGAHALRSLLPSLAKSIKINRNDLGLGIYLTDKIAYHVTFPFPVSEYIGVTAAFRLKELYRLAQYSLGYYLLTIGEKKARLFSGQGSRLAEISNSYFPMEYIQEYEYAEPSRSTSFAGQAHVKSFEKDKRALQKERFDEFIRKADLHLDHYLRNNNMRFMVCGTKTHTSHFLKITKHQEALIGVHQGGYDWLDENELAQLIWPSIEKYNDESLVALLNIFREKAGEGLCALGLEQVWNALAEGRVDTLIIEKNYDAQGYTPDNMPHLIMKESPATSFSFHSSVANEMIDRVFAQGGKLIFVDAGLIPDREPVGAICRY